MFFLTAPLWELTKNLKHLSLDLRENHLYGDNYQIEEQDKVALASFEVPSKLPTTKEEAALLHYSIANRTIIAAAENPVSQRSLPRRVPAGVCFTCSFTVASLGAHHRLDFSIRREVATGNVRTQASPCTRISLARHYFHIGPERRSRTFWSASAAASLLYHHRKGCQPSRVRRALPPLARGERRAVSSGR